MVTALDRSVGTLVAELRTAGMWEHTVFIFFSDNGAAPYAPPFMAFANNIQPAAGHLPVMGPPQVIGSSNWPVPSEPQPLGACVACSNCSHSFGGSVCHTARLASCRMPLRPLRGTKQTAWEGGVRTPAIVAGGAAGIAAAARGGESHALLHVVDLHATVLELAVHGLCGPERAQVAADTAGPLDGTAALQWMSSAVGAADPQRYGARREVVHMLSSVRFPQAMMPVFTGEDVPGAPESLLLPPGHRNRAIRVGRWKLLEGNVGDGNWFPRNLNSLDELPAQLQPGSGLMAAMGRLLGMGGMMRLRRGISQMRGLFKAFFGAASDPPLGPQQAFLYDIEADPQERHDLAPSQPGKVAELRRRLDELETTAARPSVLTMAAANLGQALLKLPGGGFVATTTEEAQAPPRARL